MEYPVLISYLAWGDGLGHALAERLARPRRRATPSRPTSSYGRRGARELAVYVAVNAVGVRGARPAGRVAAGRGQPAAALGRGAVRASPALLLTGLVNWDLLAVVLVAGALWAWSRDRPVLTGVLIGLGTAAKLYPLFLLGGAARHLPAASGGSATSARPRAAPRSPGWW